MSLSRGGLVNSLYPHILIKTDLDSQYGVTETCLKRNGEFMEVDLLGNGSVGIYPLSWSFQFSFCLSNNLFSIISEIGTKIDRYAQHARDITNNLIPIFSNIAATLNATNTIINAVQNQASSNNILFGVISLFIILITSPHVSPLSLLLFYHHFIV